MYPQVNANQHYNYHYVITLHKSHEKIIEYFSKNPHLFSNESWIEDQVPFISANKIKLVACVKQMFSHVLMIAT